MLRDDSTSRRHFSTFSVNFFTWRHKYSQTASSQQGSEWCRYKYSQTEPQHSRTLSGAVTSTPRQSLVTPVHWVVPLQVQPDRASSQQSTEWCRHKYSQTEPHHNRALSGAVTSTARQRLITPVHWVVPLQVQPDRASTQQGTEWCRHKYSQTEPQHSRAVSGVQCMAVISLPNSQQFTKHFPHE